MLAGYDAVICPTVPITAPPVSLLDAPDIYARLNLAMLRNTCVVSFLGLCAVTIPAGLDGAGLNGADMPVGLQRIGAPRTEARLLAVARHLESILARADVWQPNQNNR